MTPRLYPDGSEQVSIQVRAVQISLKEQPRIWKEEIFVEEENIFMAENVFRFKIT